MSRILIAEDESRIAAFIEKGLSSSGFNTVVVQNGLEAVRVANSEQFDLLVLDIGLPGKNGWAVLKELRARGEQLPIIVLTIYDDVNDKVTALEAGANDYITKPFRLEELIARIRARLRDRDVPRLPVEMTLKVGRISLDLRTRSCQVDDALIDLSTREFTLLETLMRHPNQILSREQLLSCVWGYSHDPGTNVIDVYIGYLRKKLGSRMIETVRGTGYRLRT